MSFSSEAKNELRHVPLNRTCCARAEAYGVLLYCHTFDRREIRIITANDAFAQRLPKLFRRAFSLSFDHVPPEGAAGKRTFLITALACRLAAALHPTEAGKILPFLLSFGGLSVCCQVSACFGEEPLSWGKLLWGRLLHGLLTALLAVPWLKRAVLPAMTGAAVPAFSVGRMLWGSGALVLLCLLLKRMAT